MFAMQPSAWRNAWGHCILNAKADDRQLPLPAREFLSTYGLPSVVIFESDNSFEISFLPLTKELVAYSSLVRWGDFFNESLDREWAQQLVIGDEDFCNGSASYCVHRAKGHVSRIDCELESSQSLVNSTVELFGMSLFVAREWSADLVTHQTALTADSVRDLAERLKSVDAETYETENSFWPGLIEFILDGERLNWEITNDPTRSKPRF